MTANSTRIVIQVPAQFLPLQPVLDRMIRDIMSVVDGKADAAQVTADAAQSAADGAQADATLSLAQIAEMTVQNARDLKRINYLRHWYG